jgi:hypothetical protein
MGTAKVNEILAQGLAAGDSVLEPITLAEACKGIKAVTNNARRALHYICKGAPRTSYASVAASMGVTPQTLGGFMSSYGHSAPSIQALIERNNDEGFYRIEPEVAGVLLEALRLYWEDHPEEAPQETT